MQILGVGVGVELLGLSVVLTRLVDGCLVVVVCWGGSSLNFFCRGADGTAVGGGMEVIVANFVGKDASSEAVYAGRG